VVFIANPNNPTGTFLRGTELEEFLSLAPRDVAVVIDEAYTEYLPPECRYESVAWLKQYRNLVLTRTFSKAYGLAGLRVGFALTHPDIADLLNRVRQPFNVNSLALAAATAALADRSFVAKSHKLNRSGMQRLERGFRLLGLEYIPSCANFLSFRVPQAGAVYQKLLRQGVIVRPVAGYGMPDHLRVTVGTPKENERFLKALRTALDE
jgi:histidinol-phosphate aminotransferase